MDKPGKEALEINQGKVNKSLTYFYKKKVEVPMLTMCDDLLSIQECGVKSVETNAYVNACIESKMLTFNADKCHKMHVGKENSNCPSHKAHEKEIDIVIKEKYVGDVVSKSGKNDENIKARIGKLIGVISTIMSILNEVSLGAFYFEMAKLLRETMFLSVMLLNSECWINITKKNIEDLESIDRVLVNRILQLPRSSPVSGMYLEMGLLKV